MSHAYELIFFCFTQYSHLSTHSYLAFIFLYTHFAFFPFEYWLSLAIIFCLSLQLSICETSEQRRRDWIALSFTFLLESRASWRFIQLVVLTQYRNAKFICTIAAMYHLDVSLYQYYWVICINWKAIVKFHNMKI